MIKTVAKTAKPVNLSHWNAQISDKTSQNLFDFSFSRWNSTTLVVKGRLANVNPLHPREWIYCGSTRLKPGYKMVSFNYIISKKPFRALI